MSDSAHQQSQLAPLDDALALATRVDAYTVTGRSPGLLLMHGGNQPDHWAEVYDTQMTSDELRTHATKLRAAADTLDAEAQTLDAMPR